MNNETKIKDLLFNYSFKDIAMSFFVLSLWLPNVASPIKIQWLYVLLESIFDKLPKDDRIKKYNDSKEFFEALLPLLPSFPSMEDYVPESDWGEIKYFFHGQFFKIFYGGDLSNTYDYYYSFEIVHAGFEDFYILKTGRSPMKEFEFCMAMQDKIITGIDKATQETHDLTPGDISVPSEVFWSKSIDFLNRFDPLQSYGAELVSEYTKDLDQGVPIETPSEEEFVSRAHDGKNCFYFFLKRDRNIFPVLPRKYFSVLFDKWGKILSDHYPIIENEVESHPTTIGLEVCGFVRQRIKEGECFCFVSAIQADLKPHKTVFTIAFRSRDKLILVNVLPHTSAVKDRENRLKGLVPDYQEAQRLFSTPPTKIGLRDQGKIAQVQSTEGVVKALEPLFVTVIPYTSTEFQLIGLPEDLPGEIIALTDFLGILDEIEDPDDLAGFFEFKETLGRSNFISPMASCLDMFGAFKDSYGVLVAGASRPDFVALYPHWGSSFRYRSLSQFWNVFPEHNFFGSPRSWSISKEDLVKGGLILKSKTFVGYAYYCSVGEASLFINSPVDSLIFDQIKITDLMMHSLVDSIKIYHDILQELPFTKEKEKIHVLFFPLSLVNENNKFTHLRHLIPQAGKWAMDTLQFGTKDCGIRVVFDDKKLIVSLLDAKDRTVQIELLLGVLGEMASIFGDSGFAKVEQSLEAEKGKRSRFGVFAIKKRVSFPEMAGHTIPQTREYKLADKTIAEIASESDVSPGDYEDKEAKVKVDRLKKGLIERIDKRVNEFAIKAAIPVLISNIDALTNEHVRKHEQVIQSKDQEVEYEREVFAGQDKQYFFQHHKNYRYLIEKFVQLQPNGVRLFSTIELGELLALVDRLLFLYVISDFLHYGMYPATVSISSDFLARIVVGADIPRMQIEAVQDEEKIALGMIGNKKDRISSQLEFETYTEDLDKAFKNDLGFAWRDMVNLQHILCLWTNYHIDQEEDTYYKATLIEISEACTKSIDDFDSSTTEIILEFLTLKQENVLVIEGDDHLPNDLPVWEYRKRIARYSIRPFVKIGEVYYWGPHSVERSGRTWA